MFSLPRRLSRDRYLSDDELMHFLAVARGRRHIHRDRDYALFVLIVNTGIRASEAMRLRRRDVHERGRQPWLRLHRHRHASNPVVDLELNREVASAIAPHCDATPDDALLWPFTKRQSERLFRYYADKAGLEPGYRLFTLRHTAGMRLYRATRDVRLIQALMGHRWLKAANAYAHTSQDTIRAAIDAVTM